MALTDSERKALVKARKGLQRSIARRLALSETHIRLVVEGERVGSQRVQKEIARRLKLPIEEVFPPRVSNVA